MGVGLEVGYYLRGGDAGCYCGLDGGFGYFGCYEVGVAGAELGEEAEDGDEERGGGVGVEAVVGFYYYVALLILSRGRLLLLWVGGGGGGRRCCGCEARVWQGGSVGGEGCGQPGWVVAFCV